ncbi:hypothetical protein F2P46_14640 [Massilia sp. CCM 8734]|nr:hypothetical protein [Massilia sp. CCM 8734]
MILIKFLIENLYFADPKHCCGQALPLCASLMCSLRGSARAAMIVEQPCCLRQCYAYQRLEKTMNHQNWPWNFPESVPVSLRDLIGRPVRTVRPGEVITLEYLAGRVTFFLDEAGLVTDIGFEPEEAVTRTV